MDNMSRHGEKGGLSFRTERFFAVGNRWYFSTREGIDSGPYASKDRAEEGLRRFLKVAQMIPLYDYQSSNQIARSHRIY
jgi:hypothetical protein